MFRHATHYQVLRGKKVLCSGMSRPNAGNRYFTSVHAEILAIQFIRNLKNTRNISIFIWRETSAGIAPSHCCISCTKQLRKFGLCALCFTVDGPAVIDNPRLSRGTMLKLTVKGYHR